MCWTIAYIFLYNIDELTYLHNAEIETNFLLITFHYQIYFERVSYEQAWIAFLSTPPNSHPNENTKRGKRQAAFQFIFLYIATSPAHARNFSSHYEPFLVLFQFFKTAQIARKANIKHIFEHLNASRCETDVFRGYERTWIFSVIFRCFLFALYAENGSVFVLCFAVVWFGGFRSWTFKLRALSLWPKSTSEGEFVDRSCRRVHSRTNVDFHLRWLSTIITADTELVSLKKREAELRIIFVLFTLWNGSNRFFVANCRCC